MSHAPYIPHLKEGALRCFMVKAKLTKEYNDIVALEAKLEQLVTLFNKIESQQIVQESQPTVE